MAWGQLEAVADLACGTGRTGVWLKEQGVRFLDGVDLTEAMLEQARAKGIYRSLSLADLRQTPFSAHGIPATFEQPTGEVTAIEGYVHLFSEHVQAANAYGWLLRELYERLIEEEWIARRPRAARRLGWPVSYACHWQQQS